MQYRMPTTDLGDITDKVWDVTDGHNTVTFKSMEQFNDRKCEFVIKGKKYSKMSLWPMSYNDFGREYKHLGQEIIEDINP